jgi:release factor glutamine methyltransferase
MKMAITVKEAVSLGFKQLKAKGIETARLDAELLMALVLKISRSDLFLNLDKQLTDAESEKLNTLLDRRSRFEPISYIRGIKEFYSIEFKVNPSVLAPRPETEHLVDEALKFLNSRKDKSRKEILDVGTGSGAITIAILSHFSGDAHATVIDISDDALKVAKENIKTFGGLSDKITILKSDLFSNVTSKFDLIVSNPPYVRKDEVQGLKDSGRLYEPALALDGGEDGLKIISLIIKDGIRFLKESAMMLIEIGADQAGAILKNPDTKKYSDIKINKDYAGLDRVVVLTR